MNKRDDKYQFLIRAITGLGLIVSFWLLFFKLPPIYFSIFACSTLAIILVFEWPRLLNVRTPQFWLLMPIYPILPLVLAILLNQSPAHRDLIIFVVVMVSSFDFGSYAFGSLFGKRKIAPHISPRKSWEGALGGAIFSNIAFAIMLWYTGANIPLVVQLSLGTVVCGLALAGDLFESFLKRKAGVKDSGSFLPMHGGFLDRLDGMMFVFPFFFIFRESLVKLLGII